MPSISLKRVLDLVVATAGVAVAIPLVGLGAILTVLEDGRPVFFRQKRVGKDGSTFEILKLRTMKQHEARPLDVGPLDEIHPLVLRSGRWLRRFKVDELPQVLNVLRGEMSIVGPRPTIPEHIAEYGPREVRRLEVRPGLTGLAQISGNRKLSWDERIMLDLSYIDSWSLWLDLRIIWRTLGVLASGERVDRGLLEEVGDDAGGADRNG